MSAMSSGNEAIATIILDSLAEGVATIDRAGLITAFNRSAERLTGLKRNKVIGRLCQEVFGPCCGGVCIIGETLRTGKSLRDRQANLKHVDGHLTPVAVTTNLLRDQRDRVVGAVGTIRDLSREEELKKELHQQWRLEDLLSRNHTMRRLFELVPAVAASPSTVLITGESGTGKELIARAIHARSPRASKPFIAVNCGALPDNLLESELFGYRKGAFTDAKTDKPGRFARAEGGTLFLDEIGEISPALQVRLLRVLQERIYEPLGATAPVKADVRILAATNRDLKAQVEAKTFRLDLFYRLNVVHLNLPPLRERLEDVPLLAEHFIDHFNRLHDRHVVGISEEALALIGRHDFPGNVRELENIIERAFVLCGSGPIDISHLPEDLGTPRQTAKAVVPASLQEAEAQVLRQVLDRHPADRAAAAAELGMHRSTLFRRMKALGLRD